MEKADGQFLTAVQLLLYWNIFYMSRNLSKKLSGRIRCGNMLLFAVLENEKARIFLLRLF